jgi:hypothetical protein
VAAAEARAARADLEAIVEDEVVALVTAARAEVAAAADRVAAESMAERAVVAVAAACAAAEVRALLA